jgi:hypothetical protein
MNDCDHHFVAETETLPGHCRSRVIYRCLWCNERRDLSGATLTHDRPVSGAMSKASG